jgi:hypothetical protein
MVCPAQRGSTDYSTLPSAPQLGLAIDLLIGGSTVGVRVTRGARQAFKSLTWTQIERAESNPLSKLIDEVIEVSRK